jgi:hypothetical protein
MAQTNSILAGLQTIFKPKTVTPAKPVTATPAPAAAPAATPSYLNSAISSTGQVDPSSIQARATQAISNQAIPDQSGVLKAAETAAKNMKKTPEGPLADIIVQDYKSKLQGYQQQQDNWAMATQTKAESTQAYLTDIESAKAKAEKAMADSVSTWQKGSQNADKYIADASADMARITTQIKELTDQYSQEPQTALVGSIVSGVTGFLQSNKAQERSIAERYGADSKEMQDWTASKRISIGAMVGDLTSKAWDRTMSIRNTGLGAFSTAATTLATNVNWARQNATGFVQAMAAAGDALTLNMGAYVATLDAAKNTAWGGAWADWLDQSPVAVPEATPMMQQLLELQQVQQANKLAQDQLGMQGAQANAAVAAAQASSPTQAAPYSSPSALRQV